MDDAELNALVTAASTTRSDEDCNRLFEALVGREVYFNAEKTVVDGREQASIPQCRAGDLTALVFFVTQHHPKLAAPFGGMVWENALKMVSTAAGLDGLLVENDEEIWLAVPKARVDSLMADIAA